MSRHHFSHAVALGSVLFLASTSADAEEFTFSSYALGGAAFGAGATPPPGTYISFVTGYYQGKIDGPVTLGGVLLDAGLKADFLSVAVNGLHVFDRKILGGRLGASVTVPVGLIDLEAQVSGPLGTTVTKETDGGGLGDITTRLQLGWEHGHFAHLVYIQAVAPTGRYDIGFQPNIGLNRPGIDVGWGFTWTEQSTLLQFNGNIGSTVNFENEATEYLSGNNVHFEWAVGREVRKGLMLGVVGYSYRQIDGDSGPGAILGPLEGNVDAAGAGLTYTTIVGMTPLILNVRHYQEFNAENRMEGSMTFLSSTVRF